MRTCKGPKKSNIISMRITDDEMAGIERICNSTNKRLSEIMREAFRLMVAQWSEANANAGN